MAISLRDRRKVREAEKKKGVGDVANDIVKAVFSPVPVSGPVEFINSGNIILNLVLSGRGRNGGWARGRILNVVGDGSAGKTLCALELCQQFRRTMPGRKSKLFPTVKKIVIDYYNSEGVMDFNLDAMFTPSFQKDVNFIGNDKKAKQGATKFVEVWASEFARRVKAIEPGTAMLAVIDTLDILESLAEHKRMTSALKSGTEVDGSYGTEKATFVGNFFKNQVGDIIDGKDVTLLVVSQTRNKIGITFGDKQYRTGGSALNFMTHQVLWLAHKEKLFRTIQGERIVFGTKSRCNLKRSKVSLPHRMGDIVILPDNYGLDNVTSMLDYLYGTHKDDYQYVWAKGAHKWSAPQIKKYIEEKGVRGRNKLQFINYIEKQNLEDELAARVEEKWAEIEAVVSPIGTRKARW